MTEERTEEDDVIDRAIERLIADETEAFVLATVEERDVHNVQLASLEESLLAIYVQVEQLRREAAADGIELSPQDVLVGAMQTAEERGLLDDRTTYEERL